MPRIRSLTSSVALAAALGGLLLGPPAAPAAAATAAPPRPPAAWTALDKALTRVVAAGVPAATARVRTPDGVVTAAAGKADIATGEWATVAHRTRAGSITKTFVATVVLQLVEERRLTLDTRIAAVLDDTGLPNAHRITVRQLLQHTSGLYNYSNDPRVFEPFAKDPAYVWSPDALIRLAGEHRPSFAPGTGFSYSNTNYVVLGRMVEQITGNSVRDELTARILDPLKLADTYFPQHATPLRGRHLHGYGPGPDGAPYDVTGWGTSWAWAAGSLVSTPADVSRFYRALLTGRLLTDRSLQRMLDTGASHGARYGLGIGKGQLPCGTVYGHEGSVPGYWTLAYTNRSGTRQAVIAVSTSVAHLEPRQIDRVIEALHTAYCGSGADQ